MQTLSRIQGFVGDWRNLLALGSLVPLGAWIYSRVWMVNPAILGDEYIYSISARKVQPWDPAPVADFSNYLFNLVYQSTNLCGDNFYNCGKLLNLGFFLGFVFTVFLVASKFLPFWAAYGFMAATALSPLSVYVSMFLPESMYFFFIGLVLVATLRAIKNFNYVNWAVVGASIAMASLVKPHAWLSSIAIGLTLVIIGLTNKTLGFKVTILSAAALVSTAAISRLAVGLAVGGPKALGFFGVYLGESVVEQVVSRTGPNDLASEVFSPVDGVIALFGTQLNTHLLSVLALMGIAVVGLIVALIDLIRTRTLKPASGFGLLVFIWLFSMILEIVIFTGWVTGSGDDHTTRVLLRYYDFLFVIVPLAGLAVFAANLQLKVNILLRWTLAIAVAAMITPAFSGYFGTLTIQIADAPNLAGLVVNQEIFNAAAIVGICAVFLFATFPKYVVWSFLALLPVTLVGTGWQIQDQYQGFRGTLSPADKAGRFISDNFTQEEIDRALILANSRFDATNVAIWADSARIKYEMYVPGTQFNSDQANSETSFIAVTGDISVTGEFLSSIEGEGYKIYILE